MSSTDSTILFRMPPEEVDVFIEGRLNYSFVYRSLSWLKN
jgi:hypothetical protein